MIKLKILNELIIATSLINICYKKCEEEDGIL